MRPRGVSPDDERIGFTRRAAGFLGAFAAFTAAWLPPVSLAVSVIVRVIDTGWSRIRPWTVVWLPFIVLLAIPTAIGGFEPHALAVVVQGIVLWIAALVVTSGRRRPGTAFALASLVLVGALWLDSAALQVSWANASTPYWSKVRALVTGRQKLGPSGSDRSFRTWSDTEASDVPIEIRLRARLLSGAPGTAWNLISPGSRVERVPGSDPPAVRYEPTGVRAIAFRRARLEPGERTGDREFAGSVRLRTTTAATACGQLALVAGTGPGTSRKDFCVGPTWQTVTERTRAPVGTTDDKVDLVLLGMGGSVLELSSAEIHEVTGAVARPLSPLEPTGMAFTFAGAGTSRAVSIVPDGTWHDYRVVVPADASADGAIRVALSVETGLRVELADVSVVAGDRNLTPISSGVRPKAWEDHPNFTAHAAAIVAACALATSGGVLPALVAASAAIVAASLTGSRTALAVGLVLFALSLRGLIPARVGTRARNTARAGIVIALLAAIGVILVVTVPRLDRAINRTAIWTTAADALAQYPLTGLAGAGNTFPGFFQAANGGSSAPTHAHDLWLQLAATFGLPGAVAAVWLTWGLLLRGWRSGRTRGLIVASTVLVFQVADFDLLHATVILPILIAFDALARIQGSRQAA